jgi:hypothetical protein
MIYKIAQYFYLGLGLSLLMTIAGCPGSGQGGSHDGPFRNSYYGDDGFPHQDGPFDRFSQSCTKFNGDRDGCFRAANGRNCVFNEATSQCVEERSCFHLDEGSCNGQPKCKFFKNWRDSTKGECFEANKPRQSCNSLPSDHCEFEELSIEKCVYALYCRPDRDFDANTGFAFDGMHRNGTSYNDEGFGRDGRHRVTWDIYGPNNRDINGRDRRGFDLNGRLANGSTRDDRNFDANGRLPDGNTRDARGFDAAGLLVNGSRYDARGFNAHNFHQNGSDRSDRNFDVHGRLPNGATRDPRGFDAEGLQPDGSRYDSRGFGLDGRVASGSRMNSRGFDVTGRLWNGSRRDARNFDVDGRLPDGSTRDAHGFDADNHWTNGSDRDDRGFDVHGRLPNFSSRDARGFDIDGRLANGNSRDVRGFDARGLLSNGNRHDARGFDINGRLANGSTVDQFGFNADGEHRGGRTEHPLNDPSTAQVPVDAHGFTVDGLHYLTMTDRDNYGFNRLGIHETTNTRLGPNDFNWDGLNPYGFRRNGMHLNGSLYDDNGFAHNALHRDNNSLLNSAGFNRDGFYRDSGLRVNPAGQNIWGRLADEQREFEVGPSCYIPGLNDYQARPDVRSGVTNFPVTFPDAETFLRAIEEKCRDLIQPVRLQPGEDLATKRDNLIVRANAQNPTLRPVLSGGNVPTLHTFYGVDRNGVGAESVLGKYIRSAAQSPLHSVSNVRFLDEMGIDSGGLRRNFKDMVGNQMRPMFKVEGQGLRLDKDYTDFATCLKAGEAPSKEACFKNIGTTFARLAFIDKVGNSSVKLGISTLHYLLGTNFDKLEDILALQLLEDRLAFNNALEMLKYDRDQIENLYMDFDELDQAQREVTVDNLQEFISAKVKFSLFRDEERWFAEGFDTVAPHLSSLGLNAKELALLLQGNPISPEAINGILEIKYLSPADEIDFRNLFMKVIKDKAATNPEFLEKLLRFWTGTASLPSRVTQTGDRDHKLYLHVQSSGNWNENRFPEAHTCFNYLDIFHYRAASQNPVDIAAKADFVYEKLKTAIENTAGFDIQ